MESTRRLLIYNILVHQSRFLLSSDFISFYFSFIISPFFFTFQVLNFIIITLITEYMTHFCIYYIRPYIQVRFALSQSLCVLFFFLILPKLVKASPWNISLIKQTRVSFIFSFLFGWWENHHLLVFLPCTYKILVSFLYEIFKFIVLYVYTSIYTFTTKKKIF